MTPFRRRSAAAASRPGLDFTAQMRRLCADMATRLPELSHVDVARVAFRVCQTRNGAMHGVHASLTPLRFAGGERTMVRRGRRWTIQPVRDADGQEMLYLLSFYLPRFCNQPFAEKLATTIHELWHIGERFDGDVRRYAGRCFAHGPSEASYHAEMRVRANRWLSLAPPEELYAFLRHDFGELRARYGAVVGTHIATPRLVPQQATLKG